MDIGEHIKIDNNTWVKLHQKMKSINSSSICISIDTFGCGGNAYKFTPFNNQDETLYYHIIDGPGRVLIDKMSYQFLKGSELVWIDTGCGCGSFTFINPNACYNCGCGKSFTLSDN